MTLAVLVAAAFVAAEGGEELRLFQTTPAKDFREIATAGFAPHPYPAVEALDVDGAKLRAGLHVGLQRAFLDGALGAGVHAAAAAGVQTQAAHAHPA